MISFPNCKINLGLRVVGKRADGFHDLQTVFLPIALYDVLEIIEADSKASTQLFVHGHAVPGDQSQNICLKAYRELKKIFPHLPSVVIHLFKNIPIGGGLGGGSSDGAATLLLLNQKFRLNIPLHRLETIALGLGSDCPFFLHNKIAFATGRGDQIRILPDINFPFRVLLVNPNIHINTGWAFSQIKPSQMPVPDPATNFESPSEWSKTFVNDFEEIVFAQYPQLAGIKTKLMSLGASFASMSGTGSTFYGIFDQEVDVAGQFSSDYFVRWVDIVR